MFFVNILQLLHCCHRTRKNPVYDITTPLIPANEISSSQLISKYHVISKKCACIVASLLVLCIIICLFSIIMVVLVSTGSIQTNGGGELMRDGCGGVFEQERNRFQGLDINFGQIKSFDLESLCLRRL